LVRTIQADADIRVKDVFSSSDALGILYSDNHAAVYDLYKTAFDEISLLSELDDVHSGKLQI
jgi:hypothetical protein